ncbi:hypothetical protein IWW36_001195 [Coemansia brasiliensis]|uniref:RRM domain-containing protein n=1 Tax=Coemansia brasiliensis TaxID=2650707 RepID=A0A9W8IFV2_9FUNG|nr:hypothetical protein IWW36_001195 [Coemansia brasiliensis]
MMLTYKIVCHDGSRSINDRLGPRRRSRSPHSRSSQYTDEEPDARSGRGLAIAGRTRDTSSYTELRVVWVTGIPHEYTEEKLEAMFRDAGRIDKIRLAVDKNNRFLGKAEITYRLADDARNAIQVFDGEMLYTLDSRQLMMHVTYSDPQNGDYIDGLRFENTLPAPRSISVQQRLGGVLPGGVNPMVAALPFGAIDGFSMPSAGRNGGGRARGSHRGGGHWRGGSSRGRRGHDNSRPRVTAEQLDAEMDEYMSSAAEKKDTSSEPPVAEPKSENAMETSSF